MRTFSNTFKDLSQRPFVRNVLAVATGAAAAQAITIAFAPVITRMYGPESFGQLGAFMAVLGVLTPIAALTYPIAIVLPKEDQEALAIAKLSVLLALVITVLAAVALYFLADQLVGSLGLQAISSFMMLIPVAMFFAACMQVAEQWLTRKGKFSVTARVAVIQSFLLNISKTGIGIFYPVASVLIVLAVAGRALHAAMLAAGAGLFSGPSSTRTTITELKERARIHADFPLFRAPQILLNALSQSLPIMMLASLFGPASAGFYTLARTVMAVPSMLIGKSVSDVFYPKFTEAAHAGKQLSGLIIKATAALAVVGFVPYLLVVLLGPWLFQWVFGNEWRIAGGYAQWLACWLFFGFINRPSVAAIAALSLQKFFLVYEVASVFTRVLAIYVGFFVFKSDMVAVAAFSLAGALLNLLLIATTIMACSRPSIASRNLKQGVLE
jgi:O-antigen/teichoic acid export membrane protein